MKITINDIEKTLIREEKVGSSPLLKSAHGNLMGKMQPFVSHDGRWFIGEYYTNSCEDPFIRFTSNEIHKKGKLSPEGYASIDILLKAYIKLREREINEYNKEKREALEVISLSTPL